jgi:hypothetical protein
MSWHDTAASILGRPDPDPAAVLQLLEHAAVGLLHHPAADDPAAPSALFALDQAIAELADAGVTAPGPDKVGADTVHAGDVRPLLAAATAALKPTQAGDHDDRRGHDDTTLLLASARAAVFTRQALDGLPDG